MQESDGVHAIFSQLKTMLLPLLLLPKLPQYLLGKVKLVNNIGTSLFNVLLGKMEKDQTWLLMMEEMPPFFLLKVLLPKRNLLKLENSLNQLEDNLKINIIFMLQLTNAYKKIKTPSLNLPKILKVFHNKQQLELQDYINLKNKENSFVHSSMLMTV